MKRSFWLIKRPKNVRRLVAAAFLLIAFIEMGSHGMIHASEPSAGEQAVSTNERGHDDPCRSLILCSNNQRRDREIPRFGHQVMHNGLLDLLSDLRPPIDLHDDPPIPLATSHGLSRPPDPAFHPPELS